METSEDPAEGAPERIGDEPDEQREARERSEREGAESEQAESGEGQDTRRGENPGE